jgi:hypothetical protein
MRDTVWSIVLTQTPIAIACIMVAWELRGIRKALEKLGEAAKGLGQGSDGRDDIA